MDIKKIKELKEKRNEVKAQMQKMLEGEEVETRGFTETEDKQFGDYESEIRKIDNQLDKLISFNSFASNDKKYADIAVDKAEKELRWYDVYSGEEVDMRAMEVGAYFAGPSEFSERMVRKYCEKSALLDSLGDYLYVDDHMDVRYAGRITNSTTGEDIGESADASSDSSDPFDNVTLDLDRFSGKSIKVSDKILRTRGFDVQAEVARLGTARCSLAFDTAYTSTITSGATSVSITNDTAGISWVDVVNAIFELDKCQIDELVLQMNMTTYAGLLGETDDNGRPVFNEARNLGLGLNNIKVNTAMSDDTLLVVNPEEGYLARTFNAPIINVEQKNYGKLVTVNMWSVAAVGNDGAMAYVS